MKKQRVIRNKPTTLEIHLGRPMIHTPKLIILVGGTTQTLGGETNRIKAKIRDVTTPTTMQLTNIPHRDHISTHLTTHLNIYTKAKMALLIPPISTHHHQKKDYQGLRLYLKAYVRKSKITRCSRRRCEPISKIRETPSRGWSFKWDTSLRRFPNLLIASQVTQRRTREVKQRRSDGKIARWSL